MQEKVFIQNKKGLKLATIIERPDKKGKFPCVLLLHGLKGYKEEMQYSSLARDFLEKGITSVRFDASGFGESEGDFQKDYRLSNYIKDTCMIYEYIIHKGWVDKGRVGVMGHSLGGAVVLIIASKYPHIKAVVSVSTPDIFATRDELGKKIKGWMKKGFIEIDSSKVGGKIKIPFSYVLDAVKYDVRKYALKVKCPKLFIIGLDDTTVVPDQTKTVFNSAQEPKDLIEFNGMRHDYKNQPKILKKVNIEIVRFFVREFAKNVGSWSAN